MKAKLFISSCLLALAGILSAAPKTVIAVTNYPLKYFTERLTGDFAEILYQIPADQDPAFWKPADAEIAKIQQADLIVMNGATYEKWAVTTALPYERIVDTSLAFANRLIETKGGVTHSHGNSPSHTHGGTAFTTWLDFGQAAQQAEAIKAALVAEFPAQSEAVKEEFTKLRKDLLGLDEAMRDAMKPLKGTTVLASHPIYQYWGRAYGVEVDALTWEPAMDLDDQAMGDLEKMMKANPNAEIFLWEGAPPSSHIETLDKKGLRSVVVEPSYSPPAEGDFLNVMNGNIARLKAARRER